MCNRCQQIEHFAPRIVALLMAASTTVMRKSTVFAPDGDTDGQAALSRALKLGAEWAKPDTTAQQVLDKALDMTADERRSTFLALDSLVQILASAGSAVIEAQRQQGEPIAHNVQVSGVPGQTAITFGAELPDLDVVRQALEGGAIDGSEDDDPIVRKAIAALKRTGVFVVDATPGMTQEQLREQAERIARGIAKASGREIEAEQHDGHHNKTDSFIVKPGDKPVIH